MKISILLTGMLSLYQVSCWACKELDHVMSLKIQRSRYLLLIQFANGKGTELLTYL